MIFVSRPEKNVLIHGELTETNKALCFFLERGVILRFDVFFPIIDDKSLQKSKTLICHV